jgi:hypothetical protein
MQVSGLKLTSFLRFSFATVVCLILMLTTRSSQATTISVLPGSQVSVSTGDSVQIDINVSGLGAGTAPSVGVYDVALAFDPTILSFTNVSWGTGLDTFGLGDIRTVTTSAASIELFELSLDSPGDLNAFQPASFLLASISFTGINAGTSDLSLSVVAVPRGSDLREPRRRRQSPGTS